LAAIPRTIFDLDDTGGVVSPLPHSKRCEEVIFVAKSLFRYAGYSPTELHIL
jgi:hypothetical protein